ncbi:MAG: polymer-forming cytoskeletal protein [Alphaproteobacteria bacterium]
MFRKDRGMDRPTRSKTAQRGSEAQPRLDPAKIAASGAPAAKPAAPGRAASSADADAPAANRASWPRPTGNATPNRLSALLGEPVTRPIAPQPEAAPSEPRRETGKRMHIGQDISISGEITTCDVLVIDGHVDATVRDCGRLEIGPAGTLKGDIEVRNAEIGGRFDGELKVADRLTVRGTGRVHGKIRYGRLEVTVGGQLRGDIAPAEPAEPATAAAAPAAPAQIPAARPDSAERPSAASILRPRDGATAPTPANAEAGPAATGTDTGEAASPAARRDLTAAE